MRTFLFVLSFFLFIACQNNPSAKDLPKDRLQEQYFGQYQGVLPCADCEGIKTRIALQPKRRFALKMKYIGKSDSIYNYSGEYYYDKAERKLMINIDEQTKYYQVTPEYLVKLDQEGQSIKTDHKEAHMLIKQ